MYRQRHIAALYETRFPGERYGQSEYLLDTGRYATRTSEYKRPRLARDSSLDHGC